MKIESLNLDLLCLVSTGNLKYLKSSVSKMYWPCKLNLIAYNSIACALWLSITHVLSSLQLLAVELQACYARAVKGHHASIIIIIILCLLHLKQVKDLGMTSQTNIPLHSGSRALGPQCSATFAWWKENDILKDWLLVNTPEPTGWPNLS